MIYIKANDLSIGYEQGVVSSDINFELHKGDYICIIGENGAGKSTLVKTLLGLVKPLSGEIKFENGLTSRGIGYLPQQSSVQRDFPATVYEIVLSGTLMNNKGFFYRKESKELAIKNMKIMNILELKNKSYRNLSGGQQQRVLLARSLCATNEVLLLDEPVTGLDPKATADFYSLVKELNDAGITIIMISHDMVSSVKYANKILHLGKKQIFFGETKDYMKSPAWLFFKGLEDING